MLIAHAQSDEYNYETKEIFDAIQKSYKICADDLTNIIFRVFTNEFGSDTFNKDAEECKEIAKKIFSSVVQQAISQQPPWVNPKVAVVLP